MKDESEAVLKALKKVRAMSRRVRQRLLKARQSNAVVATYEVVSAFKKMDKVEDLLFAAEKRMTEVCNELTNL